MHDNPHIQHLFARYVLPALAGRQQVRLDLGGFASGTYLVTLRGAEGSVTRRVMTIGSPNASR